MPNITFVSCFSSYKCNLFFKDFSNIISKADLKTLAESDEQETVREVREFYVDSIPLSSHFATLNIPSPYASQQFNLSTVVFRRCLQALTAICLALNKKPTIRLIVNLRIWNYWFLDISGLQEMLKDWPRSWSNKPSKMTPSLSVAKQTQCWLLLIEAKFLLFELI